MALFILEIALLGMVGSSVYALRLLHSAQARESALLSASLVVDSLLAAERLTSGSVARAGVELTWRIEQDDLTLVAAYRAAGRLDSLQLRLTAWPAAAKSEHP